MTKFILSSFLFLMPAFVQADATAPDPAAEVLISEIGLRESATAVRDLPGWSPPKKIVVRKLWPDQLEQFKVIAPNVEFVEVDSPEAAVAVATGAQAVFGMCDEDVLAAEPALFWVQRYGAGVEKCLANPGMHTGYKLLTNGQKIASPALAEHAVAMMMMLARGLDIYYANQLKGEWQRQTELDRTDLAELAGRTLLVVGLGGIGTQAAMRGHGLGMHVIAIRNSRRAGPDYVDYVGLPDELNELATRADVVINTVPLTIETRGMFNAAFFDAMKPGAFYINVGRGATTVTDDLVAALKSGSIAGAGLDVTDPEPLPKGHPLWTMPRVIITPHVAGRSDKGLDRLYLLVKENLRRYVNGDPMLSVVDIERGY